MTMRQFYDWQTAGGSSDVAKLVQTLEAREISWCMIGGLAVNHWAEEPMATADVDLVFGDPQHRPSKRQKDLTDIARLIEAHPPLRAQVPAEVLGKIVG